MKWFIKCFRQYFDFKGRARRKEYWMFTLFCVIFQIIVIELAARGIGMLIGSYYFYVALSTLFAILIFIPSLSVEVRRLHDIGCSGWWMLLLLLPIIGWIALFVLSVLDSQKGQNKWGANPKEDEMC